MLSTIALIILCILIGQPGPLKAAGGQFEFNPDWKDAIILKWAKWVEWKPWAVFL